MGEGQPGQRELPVDQKLIDNFLGSELAQEWSPVKKNLYKQLAVHRVINLKTEGAAEEVVGYDINKAGTEKIFYEVVVNSVQAARFNPQRGEEIFAELRRFVDEAKNVGVEKIQTSGGVRLIDEYMDESVTQAFEKKPRLGF